MRQYPFSDPSIVTMTCHYIWLCLPAFLSPTEEVTFPLSPPSLHPIPLFFWGEGWAYVCFLWKFGLFPCPAPCGCLSTVWLFVHHVGEFHSSFIQMRGLFSLPHLPAAKTHSLSCCKFSCKLRQKCLQASFLSLFWNSFVSKTKSHKRGPDFSRTSVTLAGLSTFSRNSKESMYQPRDLCLKIYIYILYLQGVILIQDKVWITDLNSAFSLAVLLESWSHPGFLWRRHGLTCVPLQGKAKAQVPRYYSIPKAWQCNPSRYSSSLLHISEVPDQTILLRER